MGELVQEAASPHEKTAGHTGPIRVAVGGAAGTLGVETFRSLSQWEQIELTLAFDHENVGMNMRDLAGPRAANVVIEEKIGAALDREPCDVLLDFSHSSAQALQHSMSALKRKVAPITHGCPLSTQDLRELASACQEFDTPALVCPLFAIGAVLMVNHFRTLSKWLVDSEIVDVQNDPRHEPPSNFAKAIAEAISYGWDHRETINLHGRVDGNASKKWNDIKIHPVRLKNAKPKTEVIFTALGESMTVSYDADPSAAIAGIKLAVKKVRGLTGVTVGLENLLL